MTGFRAAARSVGPQVPAASRQRDGGAVELDPELAEQADLQHGHALNPTATGLDPEALRRGIEERPGCRDDRRRLERPAKVLRGRTAIGEFIGETCGRDMTHRLERVVVSGDTATFTQAGRYPDETRALCLAMMVLRDGLIVQQTAAQEWDA